MSPVPLTASDDVGSCPSGSTLLDHNCIGGGLGCTLEHVIAEEVVPAGLMFPGVV